MEIKPKMTELVELVNNNFENSYFKHDQKHIENHESRNITKEVNSKSKKATKRIYTCLYNQITLLYI